MATYSIGSDQLSGGGTRPLIIALFLVKTKPVHISIQDYIARLRLFIHGRQRPANNENIHRHIDTNNFWRDAYKKSEATQSALRDKIFELEQFKDDLNARCKAFAGTVPMDYSHGKRKRNSVGTSEASATIAGKRSKGAVNLTLRDSESTYPASATPNIASSLSDSHAATFLRHVAEVHKLSTTRKTDIHPLARALNVCVFDVIAFLRSFRSIQAINSVSETRKTVTRSMALPTVPAETRQYESRLLFIGSAFATLIGGIDILEGDMEGLKLQGSVVYGFVDIFREILAQIHSLAITSAHRQNEQRNTAAAKSRRGHPKQSSAVTASEAWRSVDEQNLELSHLANMILGSLDRFKPAHIGIVEGCLFFLLQSVGKVLEVFVFGEQQSDTRSVGPNNIPPDESPRKYSTSDMNLLIAESEASCIIPILQQAVAFRIPRSLLKASIHSQTRTSQSSLFRKAEQQLQHTLLRATLGDHAEDFMNTLKPPSAQAIELGDHGPNHGQESIREWYKHQVWRLVGWEILREQIGWPDLTQNKTERP